MEYNTIITLTALSLCILLFIRSILTRKSVKKQQNSLEELQNTLQILKENEKREMEFQNDLKSAAISTKLQKTRSVYSNKKDRQQAPERYSYAQTMFQSGMTTDNIASALGMSCYEINQLLKLANLKKTAN